MTDCWESLGSGKTEDSPILPPPPYPHNFIPVHCGIEDAWTTDSKFIGDKRRADRSDISWWFKLVV